MRTLLGLAVVAALLALALRSRRTPVDIDDGYADWSTDVYLLELATPVGPVEVESRFPFLGSEWGQYQRTDDDD